MGVTAGSTPELVREEIDSLATRYELADGAADSLQGFVGMVDWGEPNFVPKAESQRRRRDRRRPPEQHRRMASNLLAESLAGLELEPLRTATRLADIGSGAGFPGMVLAIALPQAQVTLLEKVPEKCAFLRSVLEELRLDHVEVFEGPVQEWSDGAGACDAVSSRKVGRMDVMLEWTAPLLAPGGATVLYPGRTDFPDDATDEAAEVADATGLELAEVKPISSENRRGKPEQKHLYMYQKVGDGAAH